MRTVLVAVFTVATILAGFAQAPHYTRHVYMIPVRDGVRLHTVVFTPDQSAAPLPFLITRTPYGTGVTEERFNAGNSNQELREEGYIFVLQDIRGRFESEGQFVMQRSPHEANTNWKFDKFDTYEWDLDLGPLSNANRKYFHGQIPTWNDFVNHPSYDQFWKKQVAASYINGSAKVPNLNVAGWYDQEDFYGPVKVYELYEKSDPQHLNYIVAGPWNHGGWAGGDGRKLGAIDFGSDTSQHFRAEVQAPWFAYWLKDKGQLKQPEALVFQTGSNKWEQYDSWPPRQSTPRKLYFQAGGKLSFDPPSAAGSHAFDEYVSDPAKPVPYRHRPISPTYPGPGWPTWLLEDQRFVDHRPDVATWTTDPLTEDVIGAGGIVAHLFATTSGTGSDVSVKLDD